MPDIGQPSASDKNDPDEIRDGVVTDSTRFPGGFIDQRITESGASVAVLGKFSVAQLTFIRTLDVSPQASNPRSVAVRPDGTQAYIVGKNTAKIYEYSLSTAFDVSSASFTQSLDVSATNSSPLGLEFQPDGSNLYVVGNSSDNVSQYSLSTAFDISSASSTVSFDVSTEDPNPQELVFRPDGSQLYVLGNGNTLVAEYSLSTAFDVSTASFTQSLNVNPQDGAPLGVNLSPDGKTLFVTGTNNDNIYQYSLSTAFDVSSASFIISFDTSPQSSGPVDLAFSPDGSRMYLAGNSGFNVYEYVVGSIGADLG